MVDGSENKNAIRDGIDRSSGPFRLVLGCRRLVARCRWLSEPMHLAALWGETLAGELMQLAGCDWLGIGRDGELAWPCGLDEVSGGIG